MPPDGEEPRRRYAGPFVVIRAEAEGFAYQVSVEPILPTGEGEPRTFASKHEAFGAARDLWTQHRLPCRDMTIGEVARAFDHEK